MENGSLKRLCDLDLPNGLAEIARSGNQLSPLQHNQILSTQKGYEARYLQLAAEILASKHPQTRSALREERENLEAKLELCDSLLSPLRRLPIETLSRIFQFCVHCPQEDPWIKPKQTAAILCQVSRYWYAAAKSSTSLWAMVRIDARRHVPPNDPTIGGRSARSLVFCLDLLKQCGWSLTINARGLGLTNVPIDPTAPEPKPLTSLFRHPAFKSLRKLRIDSDNESKALRGVTFPLVESFIMRWPSDYEPAGQSPSLPKLPRLSKLILSSFPSQFYQFPTSQLTHLYIGGDGVSDSAWVRLMSVCRSLKHGVFSIGDDGSEIPSDQPLAVEVNQPWLSHLTLYITSLFDPQARFTWPSLTHLNIHCQENEEPSMLPMNTDPGSPFLAALSPLTHLTLACDHVEQIDFANSIMVILIPLTQLESLVLHVNTDCVDLLSTLVPQGKAKAYYLPKLQALSMSLHLETLEYDPRYRAFNQVMVHLLSGFLQSRVPKTGPDVTTRLAPLRHLYLRFDDSYPSEVVLKSMRKMFDDISDMPDISFGWSTDEEVSGMDRPNREVNWAHWDEGFTDFSSRVELSPFRVKDDVSLHR
ncbi:hypothetical protein BKA70DRAFT_1309043, partial [Coprinopsis sp. MPI-PUGE-AT-0042]